MNKSQNGLSPIVGFLLIFVVLALVGTGWYVFEHNNNNQSEQTSQSSQKLEKESSEEEYAPPEGWIKYQDPNSSLSFYYPGDWDSEKLTVKKYGTSEYVIANSSVLLAYKLNNESKKWEGYLYYGTAQQESVNENDLTTVQSDYSPYSVAYQHTGDGGAESHFILIADETNQYLVRLPSYHNEEFTTESAFKAKVDEQASSIEQIIKSIRLK